MFVGNKRKKLLIEQSTEIMSGILDRLLLTNVGDCSVIVDFNVTGRGIVRNLQLSVLIGHTQVTKTCFSYMHHASGNFQLIKSMNSNLSESDAITLIEYCGQLTDEGISKLEVRMKAAA
ncbi:hypothetical protein L0B53_15665 [Vibrio sp. SS-MA-C1-2]|uniref:hypothetical protein n=1 Tax=Vibrio sp. SS-MA-C1-2 TaxID=2908646 RepID=UPI001F462CC5|nr:hypothetical protein [Vibrio sp. SS-MA-C1-2]UJF18444.1 hypothetical protein L0B53_15665 [Vibrio sp. SS-MA-C1-2]